MKFFSSEGIRLAFLDEGEGEPIILVHGFASNAHINWVHTGWVKVLKEAGRRVVAIDNRGHGESEKLYDPAVYEAPLMADDVIRLMDHLDMRQADVMGYSMGARITAFATLAAPERVRSAIFGGLGINMVHGIGGSALIASALEAPSLADVVDPVARAFRLFAEQTKSDRLALAACIRSSRQVITADAVAGIEAPTLVVVGDKDDIAGSPHELADLLPNGRAIRLENRDHMLAVGDKTYKAETLSFLREQDNLSA